MQADNKYIRHSSTGSLEDSKESLPNSIIKFIERNISIFIQMYIDGEVEKGLNSNFVLCMNNQIEKELFVFHHEDIENTSSGNSASIDIGVYPRVKGSRGKRFFGLEAKRLSTKLSSNREREYVIGSGGGIERFKRNIHTKELETAAMIGYLQSDTFNAWENKVNYWINEEIKSPSSSDLTWSNNDKLIKENETLLIAKYLSEHNRLSNKQIKLTHLWINLIE